MAKITNNHSKTERVLPKVDRKPVVLAPGQADEFADEDVADLLRRPGIRAEVDAGMLKVEGFTEPKAPAPKDDKKGKGEKKADDDKKTEDPKA